MKYFYTELQLRIILDIDGDGRIDWAKNGFDTNVINEVGGVQGKINEDTFVSILPISDEKKLLNALGRKFSNKTKIITEEEKETFKRDVLNYKLAKSQQEGE